MPYDAVNDFAPISLLLEAEGLLVVHPSVPVQSVPELISHARANPGKLSFASAGMGTSSHLAGELFKAMAKVDMNHIPTKVTCRRSPTSSRARRASSSPPCRRSFRM
jgi:tripartite-type tricarboxylate transporter receptor subunit TctC